MKTFVATISALVLGTTFSLAASSENTVENLTTRYGNPFIFVEDGITFSVYPDGEFDFYIEDRVQVGAGVNFGGTSITFNSGFNYDPFVQYDDYGAVIQVENVPVYYDYYGRVTQIGGIDIRYRNGQVYRLGGLHVFYNPAGVYTHYTGFINIYNRHYVYRPFHGYFIRPAVGFCLVYNRPYRRYYHPVRYTYYRPYVNNRRLAHARIGYAYNHAKAPRRENIYRNDKRVVARDNATRRSVAERGSSNVRREAQAAGRRSAQAGSQTSIRREAQATSRRSEQAGRSETARNTTVTRSRATNRESAAPSRSISSSRTVRQAPIAKRNSGVPSVSRERTVTRSTSSRSGNNTVQRTATVSRKSEAPARSTMKSASSRSGRSSVGQSTSRRSTVGSKASGSSRSVKATGRSSSGRSH